MPEYRLYFLDAAGHITRAKVMTCDNDQAAVAQTKIQAHDHGLELWQQGRHVFSQGPSAPRTGGQEP